MIIQEYSDMENNTHVNIFPGFIEEISHNFHVDEFEKGFDIRHFPQLCARGAWTPV